MPDSHRLWLILRLLPEMTRVRFYTLIDHFQAPDIVLGAPAQEIASLRGFNGQLAGAILGAPRTVPLEREMELMEKHGARLLTIRDDEYPENLRQSSFPPPILFIRGALEPNDRYSLAIVGARQATQYGHAVAQKFASRLAACGLTVVSGFARGIDSAAQRAALHAGGRTIAVLGNGLAVCYPPENARLADEIAARGALVSEYPMKTPPERFNFPERNHIIAAISLGTMVVEAAEKSGALITANQANEENRFVFAVPGDITRMNSRGTNALIQAGAKLVQRPEDILAEMRELLRGYLREEDFGGGETDKDGTEKKQPSGQNGPQPAAAILTDDETAVLEMIRQEPHHFDTIAAKIDPAKITVARLSSILLSLELKQRIKQMPGRLYMVLE